MAAAEVASASGYARPYAPASSLRRSPSKSPPRQGSPLLDFAGPGRLAESAAASSALAARKAAEAVAASEADWQRAEIETLQRESGDLRERNLTLESQILSAKDATCGSSGMEGASGLLGMSFGNVSWQSAHLRASPPKEADFRSRVEKLEERRKRLTFGKLEVIASSDFVRSSAVNSTTASGLHESITSLMQERDDAKERLRGEETATAEAYKQADHVESELQAASAVWELVKYSDHEESEHSHRGSVSSATAPPSVFARNSHRGSVSSATAPPSVFARNSYRGSVADSESRGSLTPRDALEDALGALKKQVSAQCGQLEASEQNVQRTEQSLRALNADCGVLRATREALNLELADLSERLQNIVARRRQAMSAMASFGETSINIEAEATEARTYIGHAEVAVVTMETKCQEVVASLVGTRDTQLPALRAEVAAAIARLHGLRGHSAGELDSGRARLEDLRLNHDIAEKAAAEARALLEEASRDLPHLHASASARVTSIQHSATTAAAERGAVAAPTLHLQALAREMRARADAIQRHVERELQAGDEMRKELAAAAEAGRQLQRKTSGSASTGKLGGRRRRGSSLPVAKPLVGGASRGRGKARTRTVFDAWDEENLDPAPNASILVAQRSFSPGGRRWEQRKWRR